MRPLRETPTQEETPLNAASTHLGRHVVLERSCCFVGKAYDGVAGNHIPGRREPKAHPALALVDRLRRRETSGSKVRVVGGEEEERLGLMSHRFATLWRRDQCEKGRRAWLCVREKEILEWTTYTRGRGAGIHRGH